jgi:hypothetical protein
MSSASGTSRGLGPSNQLEHVLQRGMQAERRGRPNPKHHALAVGGEEADAVDLVGEPVRGIADKLRGVQGHIPRAHAVHLLCPDPYGAATSQHWQSRRRRRMNRDGTRTLRCDALGCPQLPRLFADHLEDTVAEPLDGFGSTDRTRVYLQSRAPGCWTYIHLRQRFPGLTIRDERLAAICPGVARPRVHPDLPLRHSNRVLHDPPSPILGFAVLAWRCRGVAN